MSGFRVAVRAEMVSHDLLIEERIRRIHGLGLEIEIWDWASEDVAVLAKTGATSSSMSGYVTGIQADAGGAEELLQTAEQSPAGDRGLPATQRALHRLDSKALPVLASEVVKPAMRPTATRTSERLAVVTDRVGRVFPLQNLDTAVDHPGGLWRKLPTRSGSSRPSAAGACD